MKTGKLFTKLLAVVMTGSLLYTNQPWTQVVAEEVENERLSTQYVSDVKMFYGSEAQAREFCEKDGYIFCPQNLKDGSKSYMGAYIGYKTTDNPDYAITDLTLLDMKNSHFEEMSYEEYLDKYISEFADEAAKCMVLVNEFRKAYKKGTDSALIAYDSLNMFYVDEKKSHTASSNLLGNYMLNECDATFFEKFIQRGNANVYQAIISILAGAATDYGRTDYTWLDRAKKSAVPYMLQYGDSAKRNELNGFYQDGAKEIIAQIRTFSDTYKEAKALYDTYGETFGYDQSEGLSADSTEEELLAASSDCKIPEYVDSFTTYELLREIEYQAPGEVIVSDAAVIAESTEDSDTETDSTDESDESAYRIRYTESKTLADYFFELAEDPDLELHPERVYPLVDGMTTAQRTVLSLCGLRRTVELLFRPDDYLAQRESCIAKTEKELKEAGCADGKVYLWRGVDDSLYTKKTVITSEAKEAELSGKAVIDYENAAARAESGTLHQILQIVDISTMVVSGIAMIVQGIVGSSLWAAGSAMVSLGSWAVTTGALVGIGYAVLGALLCTLFVLNLIALVVSLAYMIYTILDMLGVFDDPPKTDYDTIPEIMIHVRDNASGTYRVRYDAVPSNMTQYLDAYEAEMIALFEKESVDRTERGIYGGGFTKPDPLNAFQIRKEYTDVAEMTGFQGRYDRWMVLYYTKSQAAGQPIAVTAGSSFVKTQHDDYHAPEGYRGVALANSRIAEDINSIKISSKTGTPLYMFIQGKSSAIGSATIEDSGVYVTAVSLAHSEDRTNALNLLKKDGFQPIEENLTPTDDYTFIGYKTGSVSNALTDLRVSTLGVDSINFGDANYARVGASTGGLTPDGLGLYSTAKACAGTPITKISVEKKRRPLGDGAEPVCLFSGGSAVDWKGEYRDNYAGEKSFIYTKQDNPDDGIYLYFWPKEQYKAPEGESEPPYISGFSYFLAADKNSSGDYGTNAEYMQKFAKVNGFELLTKDGSPMSVLPAGASDMTTFYEWVDCYKGEKKYSAHSWSSGKSENDGYLYGNVMDQSQEVIAEIEVTDTDSEFYRRNMDALYFGVSYTYNPYRAITGVSGLLTPYTETSHTLKYTGLKTPAGTMLLTNVSIQGSPITSAGITLGYSNIMNMGRGLFNQSDIRQKSDLFWMTDKETEIHTHNLLSAGPATNRLPLRRDDLKFVTNANPGQFDEYLPVCDMRSPGDYDHPMNFALDTVNHGSEYLYIYLKKNAGGVYDPKTGSITDTDDTCRNVYTQKRYVAAVLCGAGKTPEEAINNLYAKAAEAWPTIAATAKDLPAYPLVTQLDEIIPVDLSDDLPWYTLHCNDAVHCKKEHSGFVYGNESAYRRWGANTLALGNGKTISLMKRNYKAADESEGTPECAYIGVIRTNNVEAAAYGILKYYSDDKSAPSTLTVGETKCNLAGGPVVSPEGQYYLYYSANEGTAAYSAPITGIHISEEPFVNGMNSSFCVSKSDRVNNKLPDYSQLRMRTDEHMYIHTAFDLSYLPYIERLYIGTGDSMKAAYADMISTCGANAATNVDCNYNAYTNQWIAIGYRRTADEASAIRDLFLYIGDDPVRQFLKTDAYTVTRTRYRGKPVENFTEYTYDELKTDENGVPVEDENGEKVWVTHTGVPYKLVRHNLKSGAEDFSLNKGTGGPGIYLYYATASQDVCFGKDSSTLLKPIKNIAFAYGDLSPKYASEAQLAEVYQPTFHGQIIFEATPYETMSWENVLAFRGDSAEGYNPDGRNCFTAGLNYGTLPKYGNDVQHTGNKQVRMYVDRGGDYTPRTAYALSDEGYYSTTTKYGTLAIK